MITDELARFGGVRLEWYYLPSMKGLPAETDFVVLGAGVAGLRAAIELASAGRVLVLSKKEVADLKAQDGIPAALSDEDEVILHLQDTLIAGDGLCRSEAAKTLVGEAPERIEELIAWGNQFDRSGSKLVFGLEAPNSHNRLLKAKGESADHEVLRTLLAKAQALKNISVREFEFSAELETEDGWVTGLSLTSEKGLPEQVACSAVLLATGGMGQIYRNTTNAEGATGDGVAMAFRAGVEISDMEFIQFHPTTLLLKKAPRFLLSEALLGEGGYLRNIEMDRFMAKYHPLAELAPGDVVARAIMHEMEVSRVKDPYVYLDVTHLKASQLQKHFPRIYATCMQYNIDITEDLIPIRPAAHFAVGGVRTDLNGRTSLAGLYAAGEAAATGVHGANRLASNSLLEALVYGARAGRAMREELKQPRMPASTPKKAASQNGPVDAGLEDLIGQIQDIMWNGVGIVRMRVGMQDALKKLEALAPRVAHPRTRRGWEAANLHLAATLVVRAALAREESRGAHYRIDYPMHDDKKFLKHSVVKGDAIRFV
ncbi:MAG TPA: L-aspartate oxidase [Candidatus Sulfotelmatobacter sp.]|nr:L-aspartate oxidase [Candidatus Sulfotelmatobacter sp.]